MYKTIEGITNLIYIRRNDTKNSESLPGPTTVPYRRRGWEKIYNLFGITVASNEEIDAAVAVVGRGGDEIINEVIVKQRLLALVGRLVYSVERKPTVLFILSRLSKKNLTSYSHFPDSQFYVTTRTITI